MSSNTKEVSAKMMRIGDRVVRGKDWIDGNRDGNGQGTIVQIEIDLCYVKWDHEQTVRRGYCQGYNGIFRLKLAEQKTRESKKWKKLPEMLFNAKGSADVKIVCEGKTFECHKIVLGCRSDVFDNMFSYSDASSDEVKIVDFEVEDIEGMIYFIYNDEIQAYVSSCNGVRGGKPKCGGVRKN